MDERIREYGEEAAFEVGAHTLPSRFDQDHGSSPFPNKLWPKRVETLGRSSEIIRNLSSGVRRRYPIGETCGIVHDIGKALDHEIEGSHVEIGAELAAKYKENPVVINAIASHHGDVEATSVISVLVAAADALSAARPGARSESLKNYIRSFEKPRNDLKQLCRC